MSAPDFRPTSISNEETTFELTRCDHCGQGLPKYIVISHSPQSTSFLVLCAICYADYEKWKIDQKSGENIQTAEEVIGVRTIDKEEAVDETPTIKEVGQGEPVELSKAADISVPDTETEENWFQIFLREVLQGKDPVDVLTELGALAKDRIGETIMTLQTVASYPFPSVREKTVKMLIGFIKKPPVKEAKSAAKATIQVFANDSDPQIQELVQGYV